MDRALRLLHPCRRRERRRATRSSRRLQTTASLRSVSLASLADPPRRTAARPSASRHTSTIMTTYTLRRSGNCPVAFRGQVLAQQTGPYHLGRERDRYLELALYRTQAGNYVLHRHYATTRKEPGHDDVVVATAIDALVTALKAWPLEQQLPLTAIPAEEGPSADRWRTEREKVHKQLRRLYESRVEALLQILQEPTRG
jgi:hypothetical protein